MFVGMLVGFSLTVILGFAQFVIRFHYFSVYQEIGVIMLGFFGAVIGALLSLIRFGRRKNSCQK